MSNKLHDLQQQAHDDKVIERKEISLQEKAKVNFEHREKSLLDINKNVNEAFDEV